VDAQILSLFQEGPKKLHRLWLVLSKLRIKLALGDSYSAGFLFATSGGV
jgi:hypothetical protein